jgi:hypothetical protein
MGHGAWGMGHGAWGMGHGAWGTDVRAIPVSHLSTFILSERRHIYKTAIVTVFVKTILSDIPKFNQLASNTAPGRGLAAMGCRLPATQLSGLLGRTIGKNTQSG